MTLVRTAMFYLMSGVIFLVLWPAAYVSERATFAGSRVFLGCQGWLLKHVCGVTVKVEGRENLPDEPFLIASQHESTWETLFFHTLFNRPVMYAKKEIFAYPFFGRLARIHGHIPVDRSKSGDEVRDGLRRGADAVRAGRSLLIFPTGTRENGRDIRLQSGIGVLYQMCRRPLVPVLLDSGSCWPAGKIGKRAGTITVTILPAIPAGLNRRELMARLNAVLVDGDGVEDS
ncbi:lysophospholipid acyltransferase family protein [Thiosulfatihalobacter marinus]|jgi:1-acyl-sn-glycerol-3-phosphate acyltransferase|uniref:lysophospholipid acyltransferase family protein n=1 Tax=Thiosulfatihalobacter marinus TaxID=2792481 RepID=UPI0018D8B783|nr:lysophospholipid acyltransferase family protein [Thiosulfatihalobacter marinus]